MPNGAPEPSCLLPLEKDKEVYAMSCGHVYHVECIQAYHLVDNSDGILDYCCREL